MKKDLVLCFAVAALGLGAAPPVMAASAQPATASTPQPPAAADMLTTLQQVCLPLLHGGKVDADASAAGFRQKDGQWVLTIDGDRRVELSPPDAINPHVCSATIYARSSSGPALQKALDTWAAAQTPPLKPVTVDASVAEGSGQWATYTWSGTTPAGVLGVALGQEQPAAGSAQTLSQSDLTISLTPT